ncbi:TPA: phage tail spike protein [Streptococcus suis]
MLLTIHDANLKKVAFVDNNKQTTLNYYDDTWTRNLETGSSTFEFTVFKKAIQSDTARLKTYNYLNEKAFVSFRYKGKSYVFSVMTVEEDEKTIRCYCENLNLELINEYANPYKASKAMSFVEYCNAMDLLNFTHLSVGINEISDQKRTLEWEGQDTKLARLLSLAKKFNAEIDFDTQLNADSSIKSFKVNVYHEYDDNHQGVGRVRNDIRLTYGKNLRSIKRKIDKTGIYTMVRPYGKKTDGETEKIISIYGLPAWSENNADGVREFYHSGDALFAPLAAQMYPSTFTSGTQADQWIRKDLEVNSEDPNVIRAAGIANLRKNAYPSLTYEVDGFVDVEIGDTVKIYDDGFSPILLVQARVSDQKISFTNPNSNKTTFANFKALENNLSDGIQAAFERLFEASKPYLIKLSTDNGVIFKNQIGQSIVTPTLYKGGKPVVAGVTWRWSLDGHTTTGMTYTVRGTDVTDTATLTIAAYIGNDEVAVDEISFVNVLDGTMGTPGTPGRDGRTPYVHTAWANNATGTSGFSLDSSINKLYIGIYTDFEPMDSSNPSRYKWTLIKGEKGEKGEPGERGLQGIQGPKGDQGIAGIKGADGRTQYTHIAYADSADGHTNFSVSASNRKYIGMYVDFNSADSTNPADYNWTLVKGADGANGTPGKAGADGRTPYFHTAYANSYDGQQDFSVTDSVGKKYLGTYTDYTQADSTDYRAYTWTLIKGDDGTGIANVTNYYLANNQASGITVPSVVNYATGGTTADWSAYKNVRGSDGTNSLTFWYEIDKSKFQVGDKLFISYECSVDNIVYISGKTNFNAVVQVNTDNGSEVWSDRLFYANSKTFSNPVNNYWREEMEISITEKMLSSGGVWKISVRVDNLSSYDVHFKKFMASREKAAYTPALEDIGWTTTPQQLSYTKRFLWNYRIELYTDGTTKTTDPAIIGVHGEKGDRGERGLQGIQGVRGEQGIPGAKGADGRTQYTHIAYADNATGGGFSQTDQSKAYIGMYQDFTATDSNNPTSYRWTKWKGADGAQGIPGPKGADGRTPYVHFAYSDNVDGTGLTTSDNGQRYIGHYSDYTQADSTDKTKYKWADRWAKIEVGGRNYIRDFGFAKNHTFYENTSGWQFERIEDSTARSGYHIKARCTRAGGGGFHRALRDLRGAEWQGRTMTYSIDIKASKAVRMRLGIETFNKGYKAFDVTRDWQRFVSTDTVNYKTYYSFPFYTDSVQWAIGDVVYIRDPQLEDGNIATTPTAAPEDIDAQFNTKADQALTQEQLNALNEQAQLLETEVKAKASMEALSDLEKAYQSFVKTNATNQAKAEEELAEAGRRIELLVTQFGGLKELKTFIDTYMTSSNEGLIIGKNDASSTIKVSHDRISMFSAGKEVMYISQGVIHIDNGIFTASVQIGRFRTEQYHLNLDMNVIRFVG